MRKHFFAAAFMFMAAMQLSAQGIVVNKTDGTKVYYQAKEVASITTYGFAEAPNPEVNPKPTFNAGDISFTLVWIEPGTFKMGSEDRDAKSNEAPLHEVTFSDGYFIGETEVTQELWEEVMGYNPSEYVGDRHPVERVSWDMCHLFIERLNQVTGQAFRLPTEAEWEFAARGGNKRHGYLYNFAGSNTLDDVAWYRSNSYNKGSNSPEYGPHNVGLKRPNELGLYDMSGNVWEWCEDWYDAYSSKPQTDPTGATFEFYKVYRGGAWDSNETLCRVTNRGNATPEKTYNNLGFRLALSPDKNR